MSEKTPAMDRYDRFYPNVCAYQDHEFYATPIEVDGEVFCSEEHKNLWIRKEDL